MRKKLSHAFSTPTREVISHLETLIASRFFVKNLEIVSFTPVNAAH